MNLNDSSVSAEKRLFSVQEETGTVRIIFNSLLNAINRFLSELSDLNKPMTYRLLCIVISLVLIISRNIYLYNFNLSGLKSFPYK